MRDMLLPLPFAEEDEFKDGEVSEIWGIVFNFINVKITDLIEREEPSMDGLAIIT